jgi:hypothetical protein
VIASALDRPLTARIEWTPRVCSGIKSDLTLESAEKIRSELGFGIPRLRVPPHGESTIALPVALTFEESGKTPVGCESTVRVVVTARGEKRDEIWLRVPVSGQGEVPEETRQ